MTGVSPDVLGVLMAHDYPGNVRELQNIIEHAFVLLPRGPDRAATTCRASSCRSPATPTSGAASWWRPSRPSRRRPSATASSAHGGNRLAAARELGMHKSTLFRKTRLLGIELPEEDGRSRREEPAETEEL